MSYTNENLKIPCEMLIFSGESIHNMTFFFYHLTAVCAIEITARRGPLLRIVLPCLSRNYENMVLFPE